MNKIVVSAETVTHVTRSGDINDPWDADDTDGYIENVVAYVENPDINVWNYGSSLGKEMDIDAGDTVYAVVVNYRTGNTFGTDGCNASVLDVFDSADMAEGLISAALADDGDEGRYGRYSFTYEGKEYSRCWEGYFESLNSIDVWQLIVRKSVYSESGHTRGYRVGK